MATEEQTTYNTEQILNSTNAQRTGQRLTVSDRIVSKLGFYLRKYGTPAGSYYFAIRKVSDDSIIIRELVATADSLTETITYTEHTFSTTAYVNEEVRLLVEYDSGTATDLITVSYQNSDVKASEYRFYYHVATYTDFSAGGEDHAYKYTYTTPTTAPTVTIQAVTAISGTTATGNGNVTSLGDADVTQHGHCWNTTGTPTTSDSKTTNGAKAATGAFTSAITSLTAGTKYYVRAYATNSVGTSYSNEVEFTADKGTVIPDATTDPLRRASGIRRSFWAGIGGQAIYQVELALGGMSTSYVSPISSRDIPSAVTPTKLPSGPGYTQVDYQAWITSVGIATAILIFGHFPSFSEWLEKMAAGLLKK